MKYKPLLCCWFKVGMSCHYSALQFCIKDTIADKGTELSCLYAGSRGGNNTDLGSVKGRAPWTGPWTGQV